MQHTVMRMIALGLLVGTAGVPGTVAEDGVPEAPAPDLPPECNWAALVVPPLEEVNSCLRAIHAWIADICPDLPPDGDDGDARPSCYVCYNFWTLTFGSKYEAWSTKLGNPASYDPFRHSPQKYWAFPGYSGVAPGWHMVKWNPDGEVDCGHMPWTAFGNGP
jgi:hypothetical protein